MRYFLHVKRDGLVIQDLEGTEFRDVEEATQEAIAAAREILANAIQEGTDVTEDAILIADESGHELAIVPIIETLPLWLKQKILTEG
jgi:hypothetical protein